MNNQNIFYQFQVGNFDGTASNGVRIEGSNLAIGASPATQILGFTTFYLLSWLKTHLAVAQMNNQQPIPNQPNIDLNQIIDDFGLDIENIAGEFMTICAFPPLPLPQPMN